MANDYDEWIPKNSHISEFEIRVIERFLLGSLAIGSSMRTGGFIEELGLSNSTLASAFLCALENDDLKFDFKKDACGVAEFIGAMEGLPWEQREYYVCTRSDKADLFKAVEALSEYTETAKSKLSRDAVPQIKERYREVDAVLRHLRNAIAHGCFRDLEAEGMHSLFFFDINQHGLISAIGLLKESTLDTWYTECCRLAERQV